MSDYTATILDSLEEVHKDGNIYREHYQNIIYYGMALWLPAIQEWVDSVVPPPSNEELARRAELQNELHAQDREKQATQQGNN